MKKNWVIPDPHTVYRDAVLNSPWSREESAHLPDRGSWSTFRYAVKDVILGVVTQRYDRARRCLCIRAWFTGEHRAFVPFEPTRILFLIVASQAWQSGHCMDLWFEDGIPLDLRLWIEERLGEKISGHADVLPHDLTVRLYCDLAGLASVDLSGKLRFATPEQLAFHVHRGTWSTRQVQEMLRRGINLDLVFFRRPSSIHFPLAYLSLLRHLQALVLEDFALARLTGKEEGTRPGITLSPGKEPGEWTSPRRLKVSGPDRLSSVDLAPGEAFCVVPVLETTVDRCLSLVRRSWPVRPVFAFSLDVGTAPVSDLDLLAGELALAQACSLGIGTTIINLKSEVELRLAMTASQEEESEVLDAYDTRYAD